MCLVAGTDDKKCISSNIPLPPSAAAVLPRVFLPPLSDPPPLQAIFSSPPFSSPLLCVHQDVSAVTPGLLGNTF